MGVCVCVFLFVPIGLHANTGEDHASACCCVHILKGVYVGWGKFMVSGPVCGYRWNSGKTLCWLLFLHLFFFVFLLWILDPGLMGSNAASHRSTSKLPRCHPTAPSRLLFSVLGQTWILHLVTLLCFWIVTSEEINPFIKNAWAGSIYCLALQSLCSALIYQLWRNYEQTLSHAMWLVFVKFQILFIILLCEKGAKIYYVSLCYDGKRQRKTLIVVEFTGEEVFRSTHNKLNIFYQFYSNLCQS